MSLWLVAGICVAVVLITVYWSIFQVAGRETGAEMRRGPVPVVAFRLAESYLCLECNSTFHVSAGRCPSCASEQAWPLGRWLL